MSQDALVGAFVALAVFVLGAAGTIIVYILRLAVRWARVEHQLEDLVSDVKQLVNDKDKVHQALYESMREDRNATNIRLRWLEEHLWGRRSGNGGTR